MGSKYSNSGKPKRLVTAGADVYQNGSGNRQSLCLSAVLTNTTASDAVVNVWVLNDGDSPADSDLVVSEQAVPARETVSIQELIGQVLESEQRVYMNVDAADTVNVMLSFTELF